MNLYDSKIVVAIENAVCNQLEASGITADPFRLDGEKIIDVILEQIEGFVLVPRVITDEWMAVYVDPVVTKYCKDYEDLPFSVEESELPEIRESHRLPIRNAHKRLMQVIEAQEQSHE